MGRAVIPDTSIFDLRLSRRGVRLNRMCAALCSPAGREAFKRDAEAFMARLALAERRIGASPKRYRILKDGETADTASRSIA